MKASEYYKKINDEVASNDRVVPKFIDLILSQQLNALTKYLIRMFNRKIYGVDAEIRK